MLWFSYVHIFNSFFHIYYSWIRTKVHICGILCIYLIKIHIYFLQLINCVIYSWKWCLIHIYTKIDLVIHSLWMQSIRTYASIGKSKSIHRLVLDNIYSNFFYLYYRIKEQHTFIYTVIFQTILILIFMFSNNSKISVIRREVTDALREAVFQVKRL